MFWPILSKSRWQTSIRIKFMIKVFTHQSENGTIIRWEALWNEIVIKEGRVSFYYGVLPMCQDPGQPLREKTDECLFEEYLSGKLYFKIEEAFGKKTAEEVKQSIMSIGISPHS